MRCLLWSLLACTFMAVPAAALKCYACDSQTDSRCMQFGRMPSVDCEEQRGSDRPPATGCLVQMHRNVNDGQEGVLRDCYYGSVEHKERICEQRSRSIWSLQEIWYCNVCSYGDECNGHMIAGSSVATLCSQLLLLLGGILLAL